MDLNWDERHEAPIEHWGKVSDIKITAPRQRHIVAPDSAQGQVLPLDGLLIHQDSPTLLVALHGALIREKITLPRYEWLRTLGVSRKENLLFIADTTLSLDEKLSLAWYTGTTQDNLTERLVEYITHIAELCGATKIVLMGNSGGGFAAMAIGHQIPGSTAIAVSPQSTVRAYPAWTHKHLHRVGYPEFANFAAADEAFPTRFDLINLYKSPAAEGATYWYAQNIQDVSHYEDHYAPFAASVGLGIEGGRTADGRGLLTVEDWGPGHVAPQPPRFRAMIDQVLSETATVNSSRAGAVRVRSMDEMDKRRGQEEAALLLASVESNASEFDKLPDAELDDIGMHRCDVCGHAVYPDGTGEPHCVPALAL